jgi:hypothetical protein
MSTPPLLSVTVARITRALLYSLALGQGMASTQLSGTTLDELLARADGLLELLVREIASAAPTEATDLRCMRRAWSF